VRRNVSRNHRASSNHDTITNGYAAQNSSASPNPAPISNPNRLSGSRTGATAWRTDAMAARDELDARANITPIAYGDFRLDMRVHNDAGTEPGVSADVQPTPAIDPATATEAHSLAGIDPTSAQERSTEGKQARRRKPP
jgi:hypothetical protein